MKLTFDLIDCLPCMVRHTMEAAERAGADAVQREEIVRRTCSYMADMPFGQSPPEAARNIYRIIHDVTGCRDFYADAKRQYNRLLLDAYAELQGKVRKARDPFEAAARMAIGGNIIDFGSNAGLDEQSVFATLAEVESQPLALDELARLRAAIQRAGKVLYLADNAGEIVLDKLFISEFPPDTRVTVAVKGGPVLNDVTL